MSKEIGIKINQDPRTMIITKWGRIKVWMWNFILPPHIKFTMEEDDQLT